MKKAPNFGTLEKDTIGGVTAMIIDNVKVYTPDQKFVEGLKMTASAIFIQQKISLLMAIFQKMMFWMEKAPMPFQG